MEFLLNVYIRIFYTPYNFQNILTCIDLFTDIFSFQIFLFFSLNVNKILFVGLNCLKIEYKDPNILLQW